MRPYAGASSYCGKGVGQIGEKMWQGVGKIFLIFGPLENEDVFNPSKSLKNNG